MIIYLIGIVILELVLLGIFKKLSCIPLHV